MSFTIILFVCCLALLTPTFCYAYNQYEFLYSILENGSLEITEYNGNSENVVVPDQIDGIPVSSKVPLVSGRTLRVKSSPLKRRKKGRSGNPAERGPRHFIQITVQEQKQQELDLQILSSHHHSLL